MNFFGKKKVLPTKKPEVIEPRIVSVTTTPISTPISVKLVEKVEEKKS